MILGIGTDIIEVERIRSSFEKFGDRFLQRILCPDEIVYCISHKFPAPHLAVRFAAKEAISKAFGTGISSQLGWRDMEIKRKDTGEPFVAMHGNGLEFFNRLGASKIHISLSHTTAYATAVAVLEK